MRFNQVKPRVLVAASMLKDSIGDSQTSTCTKIKTPFSFCSGDHTNWWCPVTSSHHSKPEHSNPHDNEHVPLSVPLYTLGPTAVGPVRTLHSPLHSLAHYSGTYTATIDAKPTWDLTHVHYPFRHQLKLSSSQTPGQGCTLTHNYSNTSMPMDHHLLSSSNMQYTMIWPPYLWESKSF